jgi:RNA polymerase sigma factor (sigma-70 family)
VGDVYQEALLRLIDPHNRDLCRAAGGLILPWLLRWGYWRLDDLAGKQRRWQLRLTALANEELRKQESGGLIEFEPTAAAGLVSQALTLLSPRDRDLLLFRYEERLTERQIAERMSLSLSAAKKGLHDARARLKKILEDLGLD